MASFIVNGHPVTVEKNQKLIRYLRDTLHLTSVKDGCSEGACGTCHVLIDGKPTKACVPQTDKLEGKTILTVEGLSDWEKQVYTFAFGEAMQWVYVHEIRVHPFGRFHDSPQVPGVEATVLDSAGTTFVQHDVAQIGAHALQFCLYETGIVLSLHDEGLLAHG